MHFKTSVLLVLVGAAWRMTPIHAAQDVPAKHVDGQLPPRVETGTVGPSRIAPNASPELLAARVLMGALDDGGLYRMKGDAEPAPTLLPTGKLQCPSSTDALTKHLDVQIARRNERLKWLTSKAPESPMGALGAAPSIPRSRSWTLPADNETEMKRRWALTRKLQTLESPERNQITETTAALSREVQALKRVREAPGILLKVCAKLSFSCEGPATPGATVTIESGGKKRAEVTTKNVRILGGHYRRLEIPSFSGTPKEASTGKQISEALKKEGDYDAVVIDLRGNPGGDRDEAERAAQLFAGDAGAKDKRETRRKPLMVLVDARTAAAAEHFVRRLESLRNDVVIAGEMTFGGGSTAARLPLDAADTALISSSKYPQVCAPYARTGAVEPDIALPSRWDSDPKTRAAARHGVYAFAHYRVRPPESEERLEEIRRGLDRLRLRRPDVQSWMALADSSREHQEKHASIPLEERAFDLYRQKEKSLGQAWSRIESLGQGHEDDAGPYELAVSTIAAGLPMAQSSKER